MPSGTQRELTVLAPQLLEWLRARHPERRALRIDALRHASAGLSNETLLVTVGWDEDGDRGPGRASLAIRLPAVEMTFPDFDLGTQARVQETVAAAGLPTPAPVVLEADDHWLGAPFLVMPFVAGQVGPQAAAFDPWIAALAPDRRRRVSDGFTDLLARLHRVDTAATGLDPVLRGAGRSVGDEVAWWEEYLRWACAGDDAPAVVVDLLAWCRAHQPSAAPAPALLWGDARIGNVIYDEEQRIVAALDWDMAFLGPPEHDVGWFLGLEAITSRLAGEPVAGFPTREESRARYQDGLGRPLVDFEWYEIFALVRSIAITVRQIRIAAQAGVEYLVPPPDRNPVVAHVQALIAGAG